MWEWFTKNGVLKENYIQVIECGTTKKNPKQNMLELEKHLKLRDEMVFLLQKMRQKLPNKYKQVLCNPFSKV
jgi:hypothetical protein